MIMNSFLISRHKPLTETKLLEEASNLFSDVEMEEPFQDSYSEYQEYLLI